MILDKDNIRVELVSTIMRPSGFRGKLGGESLVQKQFVDELRYLTATGKLNCIWFSVPNENGSNNKPVFGAKLRALGKMCGAADLVFMWDGGCGCIEFKSPAGKQGKPQKLFEKWCNLYKVKYRIARSFREAISILREWEVIDEEN